MTYLLGDGRKATSLTSFLFLTLSETAELGEAYRHEHRFEMNRIRFCVITVLLILGAFTAAADVKVRDVCPIMKFQGEVIKNKTTKQKEPSGQGTLFVPENSRSNYIEFKGNFHGNEIDNAVLQFGEGHTFEGTATYSYEYDKKRNYLILTVNFTDGTLSWTGHDNTYWGDSKQTHSVKVNSQSKPSNYKLKFIKSDGSVHYSIHPSDDEFNYHSKAYPDRIDEGIGKMTTDNQWQAKWEPQTNCWNSLWISGRLTNGMSVKWANRSRGEIKFEGNYNTYITLEPSIRLRLPLLLGGFFEWDKENHHLKLIYPSGDSFVGTFSKVPFTFSKRGQETGILTFNDSPGSNSAESLFKAITLATPDKFEPYDGIYTSKDGKKDNIVRGKRIGQEILKANGDKSPTTFDDIVSTHMLVNENGGWAEYTNGKKKNVGGKNESGHDGRDLLRKLSRGIIYYAGKQNGDELDKDLYLKSNQYDADIKVYDFMRSNQSFYSTVFLRSTTFSTSGLTLEIDDRYAWYNDKLKILMIGNGPFFPFKGSCSHSYTININIPISNMEVLKLLKNSQDRLKLLVTFKAGEWNDYVDCAIANPTGLYLYDKSNGAILYDMSSLLGKYSSKDIKAKTNSARQADAEAERRDEAERARRYHKQAIRQQCGWCLGRGYTDGWMGKRIECTQCHGRGYVYTHYYDD